MYTGQLEYCASKHADLYRTAQKLKMSLLMKLLEAQSGDIEMTCVAEPESNRTSYKRAILKGRNLFDDIIPDAK